MSFLIVILDRENGERKNLNFTEKLSIGRSISSNLVLSDRRVSQNHALIKIIEGKCFFEDLSSTNGSLIFKFNEKQGQPIEGTVFLAIGDRVRIGGIKGKNEITFQGLNSDNDQLKTEFIAKTQFIGLSDKSDDFISFVMDCADVTNQDLLKEKVVSHLKILFPKVVSFLFFKPLENPEILLNYKCKPELKALGVSKNILSKVSESGEAVWIQNLIEELPQAKSIIFSGYPQVFCVCGEEKSFVLQGGLSPSALANESDFLKFAAFGKCLFAFWKKIELLKSEQKKVASLKKDQLDFLDKNSGLFLGNSKYIESLRKKAEKIATSPLSCFISGESGVGRKELAKYIHLKSDNIAGKFISVNCSHLSKDLIQSALFGHKKGAFTGATEDRQGFLSQAEAGTLFFDGIDEAEPQLWPFLNEALKGGRFRALGSLDSEKSNCRFLASFNQENEKEIMSYFLAPLSIEILPLRERSEEIPNFLSLFLKEISETKYLFENLPKGLKQNLLTHDYPGNISELKNILHRLIVFLDIGESPDPVMLGLKEKDFDWNFKKSQRSFEKEFIKKALVFVAGNRSEAAKLLGLSRQALHKKLQQLEI